VSWRLVSRISSGRKLELESGIAVCALAASRAVRSLVVVRWVLDCCAVVVSSSGSIGIR